MGRGFEMEIQESMDEHQVDACDDACAGIHFRQGTGWFIYSFQIEEGDGGVCADGWVEWKLTHGFFANMGGFVLNQTRAMRSNDTKATVEGDGTGTKHPVGKDLEKGVVKCDDMKPNSGALDSLEESKAENPPNVS
jgi:hypothetical protein